jgi:DNA-binding GntR family transcriptional regulator
MADGNPNPKQNLQESIYEQILSYLGDRGLCRAETLSDANLAEDLKVSRTPVRMALARLECEGLVRSVPGRGWTTIPMALSDVDEIFDLKELLEPPVGAGAACKITAEAANMLGILMDVMDRASRQQDLGEWLAADKRFHQILFVAAGNRRLQKVVETLDNQWYPLWRAHIVPDGRVELLNEQHRAIGDAVVGRDPARAASAYVDALRKRRETVKAMLNVILSSRKI